MSTIRVQIEFMSPNTHLITLKDNLPSHWTLAIWRVVLCILGLYSQEQWIFLCFFLFWSGTRSLRMPAPRPASQANQCATPEKGLV